MASPREERTPFAATVPRRARPYDQGPTLPILPPTAATGVRTTLPQPSMNVPEVAGCERVTAYTPVGHVPVVVGCPQKRSRHELEERLRVPVATLVLAAAAMLTVPVTAHAQTSGVERRDDRRDDRKGARDTRQTGREEARDAKQEC